MNKSFKTRILKTFNPRNCLKHVKNAKIPALKDVSRLGVSWFCLEADRQTDRLTYRHTYRQTFSFMHLFKQIFIYTQKITLLILQIHSKLFYIFVLFEDELYMLNSILFFSLCASKNKYNNDYNLKLELYVYARARYFECKPGSMINYEYYEIKTYTGDSCFTMHVFTAFHYISCLKYCF
jgi:hypothetical protein